MRRVKREREREREKERREIRRISFSRSVAFGRVCFFLVLWEEGTVL